MYSDFEILKAFLLILRRSEFGKNGLPYNIPVRGQLTPINSCFDVLRKFLPEEFKDKSNKEILKYLRKDPRSAERLVATHFRLEEAQELMQALEEEPVATAEASGQPTPAGQEIPVTANAPAAGMGLPAAPSISTPNIRFRQQIRQQTPQPQVESQKLFIANSSGAIVGEKEITPTSVRSVSQAPQQSKLIIADQYGRIKEPQKPLGTQTLYTQDNSGVIREHQVKPPSRFSGFNSSIKNLGSRAGVFFQQNIGKHLTGDRAMNLLGKAGRTGMDALSGINNLGGGGGNGSSPFGNFGRNGNGRGPFGRFGRGGKRAKSFAGEVKKRRKLVLILGIVLPMVFVGALVLSNPTAIPGEAAPLPITPPIGGGGDISSCKFTRAGKPSSIPSSRLTSLFQEVAAKTGVPTAALASLAMHESQNFTSTAGDNHDAFGSSNITMATGCTHFGLVGSGIGASSTGALGLMQVQPPKKIHDVISAATQGIPNSIPSFEIVKAYSADGVERGAQFIGKTADTLILQDFCDVKTSIYLGAGVLISKNGGKPPTTAGEINKSVCGYYGSCVYEGYNYGNEAEEDFKNCKPSSSGTTPAPPGPIGISLTCPINNFSIICGTATNPVNNCGHGGIGYTTKCDPTYYACVGDKYSDALYYAIDVRGNTNNKVTLPFINGNESVEWTRIKDDPIPIGGGTWGYRVDYKAKDKNGRELILDLTHLNNQAPPLTVIKSGTPTGGNLILGLVDLNYLINPAKTLNSGDQVGTYFLASINHLHIGLTVDGKFVEPIQQARMCVQ